MLLTNRIYPSVVAATDSPAVFYASGWLSKPSAGPALVSVTEEIAEKIYFLMPIMAFACCLRILPLGPKLVQCNARFRRREVVRLCSG